MTFIEDDFTDCCDEMSEVRMEDGFHEEEEIDWRIKEKDDYTFALGEKEQMSLATKSIRILADLRNK